MSATLIRYVPPPPSPPCPRLHSSYFGPGTYGFDSLQLRSPTSTSCTYRFHPPLPSTDNGVFLLFLQDVGISYLCSNHSVCHRNGCPPPPISPRTSCAGSVGGQGVGGT